MTQTTVISELDRFKLQKKRERNRIAASKCRQRKLERISDLGNPDDSNCSETKKGQYAEFSFSFSESQVAQLKGENDTLMRLSDRLNSDIR